MKVDIGERGHKASLFKSYRLVVPSNLSVDKMLMPHLAIVKTIWFDITLASRNATVPRQPAVKPYHHGDLRKALVEAAWSVIAEIGEEGLSLRECARRAGVSHAAPAHHFGNMAGLISEVAAEGYDRLAKAMDDAEKDRPRDPLQAAGIGYIEFARAYPAHFRLMSRVKGEGDLEPRLEAARTAAMDRLTKALQAAYEKANGSSMRRGPLVTRASLAWCCVHGYANLLIDSAQGARLAGAEEVLKQLRLSLLAPSV